MVTEQEIRSGFPAGSLDNHPITKLPIGTIIRASDDNYFEKTKPQTWCSLYDHCGECMTVVTDVHGFSTSQNSYPRIVVGIEDYFQTFKIIQVPYISEKEF